MHHHLEFLHLNHQHAHALSALLAHLAKPCPSCPSCPTCPTNQHPSQPPEPSFPSMPVQEGKKEYRLGNVRRLIRFWTVLIFSLLVTVEFLAVRKSRIFTVILCTYNLQHTTIPFDQTEPVLPSSYPPIFTNDESPDLFSPSTVPTRLPLPTSSKPRGAT